LKQIQSLKRSCFWTCLNVPKFNVCITENHDSAPLKTSVRTKHISTEHRGHCEQVQTIAIHDFKTDLKYKADTRTHIFVDRRILWIVTI